MYFLFQLMVGGAHGVHGTNAGVLVDHLKDSDVCEHVVILLHRMVVLHVVDQTFKKHLIVFHVPVSGINDNN